MATNSKHSTTSFDSLKNLHGIAFASQNIRSIVRKIGDIKALLHFSKLDLSLLNETWLNLSIGDSELEIEGYLMHRFDRDAGSGKRGGGGLLANSRDHYSFIHKIEWDLCSPDLEIQWLILNLPRTRPTYIANVYRPPDGDVEIALALIENKILHTYAEHPGDILIMGDMNIDILDKANGKTQRYCSFLKPRPTNFYSYENWSTKT